jgi:hypothetical protein
MAPHSRSASSLAWLRPLTFGAVSSHVPSHLRFFTWLGCCQLSPVKTGRSIARRLLLMPCWYEGLILWFERRAGIAARTLRTGFDRRSRVDCAQRQAPSAGFPMHHVTQKEPAGSRSELLCAIGVTAGPRDCRWTANPRGPLPGFGQHLGMGRLPIAMSLSRVIVRELPKPIRSCFYLPPPPLEAVDESRNAPALPWPSSTATLTTAQFPARTSTLMRQADRRCHKIEIRFTPVLPACCRRGRP